MLDRIESDAPRGQSVVGSVAAAVGSSASAVAISGRSHLLVKTYAEYMGSGYTKRLVDYPIFDLQLLMRCLEKVASSVFGCLDRFFVTEIIINCLQGAEYRDRMMWRSSIRRAIITNELQMPSLVENAAKIVGVWPLIVSHLKGTGRKTDGDSLVVKHILLLTFSFLPSCYHYFGLF